MKKLTVILPIILLAVFAIMNTNCSQQSGATNNSSQSNSGDIVYVDIDSLLNNYDLYNDLRSAFIKKQQESEGNFQTKAKAFERRYLEFQQNVEKHLITSAQAQAQQQALMAEKQQLDQLNQQLSSELAQEQQTNNKRVLDSITTFMKEYNKKFNYKMIIGNTGAILYANKELNITADVMKALNARYRASGNVKKDDKKK